VGLKGAALSTKDGDASTGGERQRDEARSEPPESRERSECDVESRSPRRPKAEQERLSEVESAGAFEAAGAERRDPPRTHL